jgi:hypothetical protein
MVLIKIKHFSNQKQTPKLQMYVHRKKYISCASKMEDSKYCAVPANILAMLANIELCRLILSCAG